MFNMVVGSVMRVSVEEGALNQLWAATGKGVVNGVCYEPVRKDKGRIAGREEWGIGGEFVGLD